MRDSSDMRHRILLAAREQFFAHGFAKVTMDELAALLGISKKTLYKHFARKDKLADAVIEHHIVGAMRQYKAIMNSESGYLGKLFDVLCLLGRAFTRMSKRCQQELRLQRPDLWQRIEVLRRRTVLADFAEFIAQGIGQNLLRPDINQEAVLIAYIGALQGVLDSDMFVTSSFSADEALAAVTRMFLGGILTEGARADLYEHTLRTEHHERTSS